MACSVSLSYSVPLCSLQNPIKVGYPKKPAFCRIQGLTTTKTASYLLASCSSSKGIFCVRGQSHLTALSKLSDDEVVSCSLDIQRQIALINWHSPLPKFRSALADKGYARRLFRLPQFHGRSRW